VDGRSSRPDAERADTALPCSLVGVRVLLPKAARITEDREFKAIISKGRSYKGDLVVMYVSPGQTEGSRFGFATARKIGKSVQRNRVKRLLRETVREVLPNIRGAFDFVVIGRPRAAGASYADVRTDVARLFACAGLLMPDEEQRKRT